ncbi:MFS transporter [Nocardioides sp. InS609-2]|uniref:MFS transporter n=1 Tax=Nocardioides sp. InS609-2 TaxID=2760705 RepID=UPI0020BE0FBE|nr:MFS transporter [Nocardioides sp. InS609-2]
MDTTTPGNEALQPETMSVRGSLGPLIGLSLGYFMVLLDSTILNVALPSIATDLGASVSGQQWTVTAYLVTFGAFLLSSGAVADWIGARRTFLIGLAAFGAMSLMCALAPNLLTLVVFRALQGAAAALIPASTLSLIGAMYVDSAMRHRAVGLWALLTGVGFAAGPLVGGAVLAVGSWHLIFSVNVPIALIALLCCRGLPSPARGSQRLDLLTQVIAVAFFGLLINALIQLGQDVRYWWWVLPAATAALAFWGSERRSSAPAIPLSLFRVATVRRAIITGFGIQIIMAGALFVLGLHLIDRRGLSPVGAGAALLPYVAGPLFGARVGRLVVQRGLRTPLMWGLALTTIGMMVTGAAVLTHAPLVVVMVGLLCAGPGLPLTLVPLTSQVVGGAPPGTAGVAGGLFNAARQLGGALGVAVLGAFVHRWSAGTGAGWALIVAGAAAVVLWGLCARSATAD